MGTHAANERPYDSGNQPVDQPVETEAERVAREQKEAGTTETRNADSMDAQNTPGPETQGR